VFKRNLATCNYESNSGFEKHKDIACRSKRSSPSKHKSVTSPQKHREISGHDTGGSQRFTGVGQQAFSVDVRDDDEHSAGIVGGEFLRMAELRWRLAVMLSVSDSGGLGVGLTMVNLRLWLELTHSASGRRGGSCTQAGNPVDPKVSRAQPP
jgi:hypothetical protein